MKTEVGAERHLKNEISEFDSLSVKVDEEISLGEMLTEEAIAHAHNENDRKEFEHINQMKK